MDLIYLDPKDTESISFSKFLSKNILLLNKFVVIFDGWLAIIQRYR